MNVQDIKRGENGLQSEHQKIADVVEKDERDACLSIEPAEQIGGHQDERRKEHPGIDPDLEMIPFRCFHRMINQKTEDGHRIEINGQIAQVIQDAVRSSSSG